MNTTLATGDEPLGQGFIDWRAFSNNKPDMDIAALMRRSVPALSVQEAQAYAVPFPDIAYKAGVRRFPNLVPDRPDADGAQVSREARAWWSSQWQGASFMAVGMCDPVLSAPTMPHLRTLIRDCPEALEVAEAGHFVQEHGEHIAHAALAYFEMRGENAGKL
jgi:haloalkane dehalogenase